MASLCVLPAARSAGSSPGPGRSFDLGHGHDVQRVVHLPIAGPRQAMPLDVTGGHFYRRDTAIRGERGLRPERVDRAGTGQDLRRDHVCDAVQVGQGGADAATAADNAFVASVMCRSRRRRSLSRSTATWRRVRASTARGRMLRSAAAAVSAVSPRGRPAGMSWASSACSRLMVWRRHLPRSQLGVRRLTSSNDFPTVVRAASARWASAARSSG
jgi:hypothetical protein